MRHLMFRAVSITLLAAGLSLSPLLNAQTGKAPSAERAESGAEASPLMRRHHDMAALMQDMTREMGSMQGQMDKAEIAPEMRKEMSRKMKGMADLMRKMSGLIDRPTMKDAEADRQLGEMRKQMNEMSKTPSMKEQRK